jgi:hypothetical protein
MKKARDQFLQEIEDFARGKRKKYPALLAEPLYVDSKLWGPKSVQKMLTKPQRQEQFRYRQTIVDEYQTRWGLLCLMYGMDPVMPRSVAEWRTLCGKLAARHVPGLQTTNIPPHAKKRGAPRTRGPEFAVDLFTAVNEARARVAKKQNKVEGKVSIATAIKNLNPKFYDKWKTASGKRLAPTTLETRYHEAAKISNAARERGPQLTWLQELEQHYKNSEPG